MNDKQSSIRYEGAVGNPAKEKPTPGNPGTKVGGGSGQTTGGGGADGKFPGVQGDPFK